MKCPKCDVIQNNLNDKCSGCGVIFKTLIDSKNGRSSKKAGTYKKGIQYWKSYSLLQKIVLIVIFAFSYRWGYNLSKSIPLPFDEKPKSVVAASSKHALDAGVAEADSHGTFFAKCIQHRETEGMPESAAQESCKMYQGI